MLRHYLLITLRILWRNKVTSFVNIFSLSVGITAFIFIMLYVHHEMSYDKFNTNYDRIYRLEADDYGKLPHSAGLLLKDRLPEVEDVALMADGGKQFLTYSPEDDPENLVQTEVNFFLANQPIFDVFTLPLVKGDPNTALKDPFTAVLTESTANKLFGAVNPLNKTIVFKDNQFLVTGIIRDVENSHVEIEALLSQESNRKSLSSGIQVNKQDRTHTFIWSGTYLLVEKGVRMSQVEEKMNRALEGQVFYQADSTRHMIEVVGVVKDFHFRSFHDRIEPLSIGWWGTPREIAMIKLPSNDIPESIRKIEKEWREVFGQAPFAYQFLDENFDQQYKSDEQLAKVIGYFTVIAVIIACLGLFALSSFMVSRRVKEIGVRKVLGASVATIYSMLSWDFMKWILAAIVIAAPVAWYLVKMWLSKFAYHIDLGVDVFVIAALIAIGIALLTVTGQSLKVARANPVEALKYE